MSNSDRRCRICFAEQRPRPTSHATTGLYHRNHHSRASWKYPAAGLSATMASTKLNVDGMMLLEQPFARVPYENYRKVFRANQRALERELTAVQTTSSDLSKRAKNGTSNSDDALKSVDGMIGRVENLKRKARQVICLSNVLITH